MILEAERLVYRHAPGTAAVLDGISLSLGEGEIVCLLGPNGTGKTTLLRCLSGGLQAESGSVRIDGETDMPARQRALKMAYVPQAGGNGSLNLLDVALMGRTPYLRPLAMPGTRDRRLALEALERVGIAHLAQRPFDRVSGGERQLALIARALAQQPRLFLMDEPTASLDIGNQVRVLSTLRALADDGLTLLVTSHQPDHALLLGARVVALRNGRVHAAGRAADALQAHTLSALYGIPIDVLARDGVPVACVPYLGSQIR
ncbi:MAG: ABC transporter ATP-binding protein [Stenotrophomonas sp.]